MMISQLVRAKSLGDNFQRFGRRCDAKLKRCLNRTGEQEREKETEESNLINKYREQL